MQTQTRGKEAYTAWLSAPLNEPLPKEISFYGWSEWGKALVRRQERVWWKIAFWLLHGERVFAQTYVQIAEDLGLSKRTLYQATMIAKAFEDLQLTVNNCGQDSTKVEPVPLPSFWNCQPLANAGLQAEERLMLASEAVKQKFSQSKIETFVREFLKAKSLPEEPPAPSTSFSAGLAANAPDDGLPIAPNGKAEKERAKAAGEAIAAKLPKHEETSSNGTDAETGKDDDPFDESTLSEEEMQAYKSKVQILEGKIVDLEAQLECYRVDALMYRKLKPSLERIEACIEEGIVDWLKQTAETLEEEKKFYAEAR